MQDPQYINHTLNTSPTKNTFSFNKSSRFMLQRKKIGEPKYYDLPSTKNKRSCSFGFGAKISLTDKKKVLPPPGSYQLPSDFNSKQKRSSTISFSPGRKYIKFQSFLFNAERLKTLPSPSTYTLQNTNYYSKSGGRMAAKLPSDIDLLKKRKTPGPGAYQLDITQMKKSGSYILSKYCNKTSPKYHHPSSPSLSPKQTVGPGAYNLNKEEFGVSLISKFKSSIKSSFNKTKRPTPNDQTKLKYPGFKYNQFSEFGGERKNQ